LPAGIADQRGTGARHDALAGFRGALGELLKEHRTY